MAIYGAVIASPLLHPSLSHLSFAPKHRRIKHPFLSRPAVSCQLDCGQPSQDDDVEKNKRKINGLELLKLSATVTIITASLPPQAALAAAKKTASSSEKKKRASSSASKKQQEALTPDQYNSWAKGLPVVTERLACTDLFDLKSEGKLKHIIKPPISVLGHHPEVVLVVLDDSRVFRTVLPSMEGNPVFWRRWDEMGFNSLCVNAYTPPVKKPEVPSPYLGFLSGIPRWMLSIVKSKAQQTKKKPSEAQMAKEKMKRRRLEELERMDNERKMLAMAVKTQKKMEERALKQLRRELKMQRAREMWNEIAERTGSGDDGSPVRRRFNKNMDSLGEFAIAIVLFALFYKVVVLGYKQQMKDYDDRIKIEKAEAEERKKMRALEREMAGLDPFGDDEEEVQGGKGENNPLQIARNFVKSGAKVRRAKLKKVPQFLDKTADVKFSDVAGIGLIRVELEEIVKFFTEADVFRRRGVKIPGGILLSGPPGVGKTLLAKAVAGEAGVNFLFISASQFVEIYVGVGASRVRALYEEAKELAPAVVFIDELDAVGRTRGLIKGSGGQERDATLNQLLVCLDGFEGRGDVITIASTNRPDILDPALVRPGRFDRKIEIPRPSYTGRMEILKIHARNKPVAEDVDYSAVARESDGMSGAQLANVIEIAALYVMREGRPKITTDDLIQAAHIEHKGLLERWERSPNMWRTIALNQVAPAVAALNFEEFKNVEFITIAPRAGSQLGYFRYKEDDRRTNFVMRSRQTYLNYITMQLASRAADELFNGEDQLSTISAERSDEARAAARTLVLSCLTDKHYGMTDLIAVSKINDLDLEAQRILLECYERAKEIMRKNRKLLEVLVEEVAEKKSLTKEEFFHFANKYAVLEPPPPSLMELREQYRKSFKENMISDQSQPKQLTT